MLGSKGSSIQNGIWRIKCSHDWWRHVTLTFQGQGRDPDMFGAQYFENGWAYRLVTVAHLYEIGTWGIKRSRVQWRHVTLNSQDRALIYLEANIEEFWMPNFSKTVGDKGSVPKEHPWDGTSGIKWSRDRQRHNVMTLKSSWWSTYMWMQMSEKPLEIEA